MSSSCYWSFIFQLSSLFIHKFAVTQVRQREEDTRSCKMMLRFREDKIHRLESQLAGSIPTDTFLQEENKALSDEIQILQSKLDRNPEVTRFAVENIRLLDQLRR